MIVECSDEIFSQALIKINKKKKFIHSWISSTKIKGNFKSLYNQDCINGTNFKSKKKDYKRKILLKSLEFSIAKNMLKRQTPLDSLTDIKKNQYLNYLINNWNLYLKENKIDSVIFYSTPHLTYSYIIYCLCKKLSIRTKIIEKTKYLKFFFFSNSIENIDIQPIRNKSIKTPTYIRNYLDQFEDGEKIQTHSIVFNDSKIELFRIFLRCFIRPFFKENIFNFFFKKQKTRFHNYSSFLPFEKSSFHTKFIDYFFYFKSYFKCKDLKKKFNCKSVPLKEINDNYKYILFSANYQPEKSTSPDANKYFDQFKILKILNDYCLKNQNYKILYKEHPSQFLSKRFGFMEKNSKYYKEIFNLKKIIILNLDTSVYEAINKSEVVATATSETALQSVLLNKPSIIFGNVWFAKCRGVFKYKKNLKKIINIAKKQKFNRDDVKKFLNNLDNKQNLNLNINKKSSDIIKFIKKNIF
jgi:hypothetical protein